jgi:medium-chain acyl-[acyl-carrier-protein] hydrolase
MLDKKMIIPLRESNKVRTYEVDFNNRIKPSAIFNYMQEAASNDAARLNFGYDDLMKKGLFWVLSRAKLVMMEYPSLGDEIIIETWHKGSDKLFGLRDFKIYNSLNEIIGTATTSWLLVDVKTLKPSKLDVLADTLSKHDVEPAMTETLGKISEPETTSLVVERNFGYADIDVNKHVNNVKYVECVLDAFPLELYGSKKVSAIQINFLSESKYGDRIKISIGLYKNKIDMSYVEGRNQNGKVFQSVVEWQ